MITFTSAARQQIAANMDVDGKEELVLRLRAKRRGPGGFDYDLTFVGQDEGEIGDRVVETGDFSVFLDPESADLLRGTTIDFVHTLERVGFDFDNPNSGWKDPIARRVQEVIDRQIDPRVGAHGGSITLLEVRDGVALLTMGGGCQGCSQAAVTLRQGVEARIKEAVPEILRIVDTTDHQAGENPFLCEPGEGDSPFG